MVGSVATLMCDRYSASRAALAAMNCAPAAAEHATAAAMGDGSGDSEPVTG